MRLLIGCNTAFDKIPTASLASTLQPFQNYPITPDETTNATHPFGNDTTTLTLPPDTRSIIPTVEDDLGSQNGFSSNLPLFFREEIILMASNGVTAIHPTTGATLKLEEDTAAWFPNPTTASPLSADGKWIAYAIRGQKLVLLNTSTAKKTIFAFPAGLIQRLAWMPDSKHILLNVAMLNYVAPEQKAPSQLYYLNIETNTYTLLYNGFQAPIEEISPDGESFLYYNPKYDEDRAMLTTDIMLGYISGKPPMQLTDDLSHKFWMDLAPDGQSLAVFAFDPSMPVESAMDLPCHFGLNKAYVVNIRTQETKDYSIKTKSAVEYMRLSPDGSKIAYVNAEGGVCAENFPIYILNLGSGIEERLNTRGFALGWSPDGSKVVFIQYSSEFQYNLSQLVIYDLLSDQVVASYYIEDVNKESAVPYWVRLKH